MVQNSLFAVLSIGRGKPRPKNMIAFCLKRLLYDDWAFGKSKWAKYIGDIGEEPPLPKEIFQIMTSPCPDNPRKRIYETHVLTLIPKEVNKQPLTLNSLGEHVQNPKKGNKIGYRKFPDDFKEFVWKSGFKRNILGINDKDCFKRKQE